MTWVSSAASCNRSSAGSPRCSCRPSKSCSGRWPGWRPSRGSAPPRAAVRISSMTLVSSASWPRSASRSTSRHGRSRSTGPNPFARKPSTGSRRSSRPMAFARKRSSRVMDWRRPPCWCPAGRKRQFPRCGRSASRGWRTIARPSLKAMTTPCRQPVPGVPQSASTCRLWKPNRAAPVGRSKSARSGSRERASRKDIGAASGRARKPSTPGWPEPSGPITFAPATWASWPMVSFS